MTAYQRVTGWAVLLVVLLAASTVGVQAEDGADEQALHEWIETKIREIIDSASSTATEMFENGEKRAEIREYTDRAISGEKEPDSKALELLEKTKKMAFDKFQTAIKRGSAESVEAAEKQYRTVSAKLSELTQQVKDKMANTVQDNWDGLYGHVCQSCNDCDGSDTCCRGPLQQGSGVCSPLGACEYGEGYCPPP